MNKLIKYLDIKFQLFVFHLYNFIYSNFKNSSSLLKIY